MIIAGSFPDIVSFAASPARGPMRQAARGRPRRGNGHDRDAKLAALIRDEPGVTIAEMSRRLKAAANTVRAGLERLEKPLQSSATENPGASPNLPVETAKWTAPVSAHRRRDEAEEHAHA